MVSVIPDLDARSAILVHASFTVLAASFGVGAGYLLKPLLSPDLNVIGLAAGIACAICLEAAAIRASSMLFTIKRGRTKRHYAGLVSALRPAFGAGFLSLLMVSAIPGSLVGDLLGAVFPDTGIVKFFGTIYVSGTLLNATILGDELDNRLNNWLSNRLYGEG
ncbi:MAG: hypothetical protein ABEI07_01330 [Candidatus Nanohaloarchaea archaeon]